jgi:uncharacterized protein (UPF0548 family)
MQQFTKLLSFTNSPIRNCFLAAAFAVMLVSCGGSSTPTFSIGGTVSGLTSGSLVLKNSNGDDLTVSANSTSFTFAIASASGAAYAAAIATQPSDLVCSVKNGVGTIANTNVTNVEVACAPPWIGTKQLGVAGLTTYGYSVATDAIGNVYVAGVTNGGLDGNTLTGVEDFFVTKFNSSGVKQYTKQMGVAGKYTYGYSVTTDANGNVYVAGYTYGGLDGNTLSGIPDFFVTKFNSSGVKQYTKQMGVPGETTYGTSVTTDANGNVYVAGYTHGGLDGNTLPAYTDFFVTKYDINGVKQFTRQMGGFKTEGRSVAADANGNVYVAGNSGGTLDGNASTGYSDFFVTKFNSSGVKQYTKQMGVPSKSTFGTSVTTDASGNVYVTGITYGGLDGNTLTGKTDFFVTKYDSSGVKQFTKQMGIPGKITNGMSVTTDANRNVYVAGYTYGGLDGNTLNGKTDFFITKYDSSGVKQFTKQLGVSGRDTSGFSVASDANGNVFVAGTTFGGLDGNSLTGTSDFFVTKYNSSGVKQ